MGAHSGTSSDKFSSCSYYDNNSGIVLNTGLERHGIKSMVSPHRFMSGAHTYF